MPKVVIIGAGLTGLSAAYHLEQQNFFDYEIFEKNDRPGGLLRSVTNNEFTFDYTGHFLHIKDPRFYSFLTTIAAPEDYATITRNSAIYSHHVFTPYPFQLNLHGLPTPVICDCLEDFINRPKHKRRVESFHDWVIMHFGKGLAKHFFFPYNSKLLAWPVTKMHHSWTGRFVPQTNLHQMLYNALENAQQQSVGYNSSFFYPKQGGIEFIIRRLVSHLHKKVHAHHEAVSINPTTKTIKFANGTTTTYQTLITTAPLKETLKNISSSPLTAVAQKLRCTTVINFNLGFSQEKIGPYHWIYFPENSFAFYRIGFWHNIWHQLAKPGHSAIYGEFSYQPSLKTTPDYVQQKLDQSIEQTLKFLQLSSQDIVTQEILPLHYAYVIYDTWRQKNLYKIFSTLKKQDIISTGRFGGWQYTSMEEAFFDGMNTAHTILASISKDIIPARTMDQTIQHYQVLENKKGVQAHGNESS